MKGLNPLFYLRLDQRNWPCAFLASYERDLAAGPYFPFPQLQGDRSRGTGSPGGQVRWYDDWDGPRNLSPWFTNKSVEEGMVNPEYTSTFKYGLQRSVRRSN